MTGNPVEHSGTWVTSVKARANCRQRQPAHASSRAGSKTDKARGWRFHYDQYSHPRNPAESAALRATPNGRRERSNPPPLSTREQPARRMGPGGGIGPEAKAPGKAGGYADGAHERTEGRDARRRDLLSTPATGVQRGGGGPAPAPEGGTAEPRGGGLPRRAGRAVAWPPGAARGAVTRAIRRGSG